MKYNIFYAIGLIIFYVIHFVYLIKNRKKIKKKQKSIKDKIIAEKKAVFKCRNFINKNEYFPLKVKDCNELMVFDDLLGNCKKGCIGGETCIENCPYGAIKKENGKLIIDHDICIGCGICATQCPRNVIQIVSSEQYVVIECQNEEEPWVMRETCNVGCIDCRICLNKCPYQAIYNINEHCEIDSNKCHNCGVCAKLCPLHIIADFVPKRPIASINMNCNGCGKCMAICPLGAIKKSESNKFFIETEKCGGCGLCLKHCTQNAIIFLGVLGSKN